MRNSVRRGGLAAVVVSASLAGRLAVAKAQPVTAAPAPERPVPTEERRYLGQMIAVDVASVALLAGGALLHEHGGIALALPGAFGLAYGAPLVHHLNGNGHGATVSLGLHLLLQTSAALIGTGVGLALAGDRTGLDAIAPMMLPMAIGSVVGMAACRVYDYGYARTHTGGSAPALAPAVVPTAHGVTVGLLGSY